MRLLLTSDLHYKLRQYDWLMHAAPHFDAVVIAGDHIDANQPIPAYVQIAALRASFAALALKSRVLVCSGNHDLCLRNSAGEKAAEWLEASRSSTLAVDGDTVEVADALFTICPWWDGPHGQAAVARQLESAALQRRGAWVWVYHAPPQSALSWTGKRHYGDAFLPELIERYSPTAVLCGHIHEAPFRAEGSWIDRIGDTWLFNAGRQDGDVPARIEIDFATHTARWISYDETQERSLDLAAAQ